MVVLTPDWQVVGHVPARHATAHLLAQPGMYAADLDFARRHAQPVLHTILDTLEALLHPIPAPLAANIDVRVHQLRRGDYPATPGWHCDAPLRETAFTDAATTVPISDTLLVSVSSASGGVSNTVFAPHPVTLTHEGMDAAAWRELDTLLGSDPDFGDRSADGQVLRVSATTGHRVEAARTSGVRLFVRCSLWTPPPGHRPGLARTEQVYRTV